MLSLRNIYKGFGGGIRRVEAVAGLSLEVEKGEFLAVVGPSGCGKTTALKIAAGLLAPDAGEALLDSVPAAEYRSRKSVGYVPQSPALLAWRTSRENAHLAGELGPDGDPGIRGLGEEIERTFDLLDISNALDLYPDELSGGMKQRVAVARALVCDAPMVFMDEPFSALDALTRERLWVDISAIFQSEDVTSLLVTHHILEAIAMADRILVLSERPARAVGEVVVDVPRPRSADFTRSPEAQKLESKVRSLLEEDPSDREEKS